jgi:HlyD family secretion protein
MGILRKALPLLLAVLLTLSAVAVAETTFDGTVVAGKTVSVVAPFGGTINAFNLRVGDKLSVGDPIATVETTKVYAPQSGTITGLFGQPGDNISDVQSRYGALLYIAPERKFSIAADIEKAYNSTATKYVNIGEKVTITCVSDGAHTAKGVITAISGTGYTVETTEGELLMEETVNIYRGESAVSRERIGRGDVSRTAETAVNGSGSLLYLHVKDGDTVARGDLLFETVADTFNGLYATSNEIVSDVGGVIASVNLQAGSTVNKGSTLLTVYPDNSMQIEISVDEYDLSSIAEGDKVNILFNWDDENEMMYEGTVQMISHVSSATEGDATYNAYIDFQSDEAVRIGMTVVVYTKGGESAEVEEDIEDAEADAEEVAAESP